MSINRILLAAAIILLSVVSIRAQTFSIENEKVRCTVTIEDGRLISDRLEARPEWASKYGTGVSPAVETDADFTLDVMYADWRAPGKQNNADNPILLTAKDFRFVKQESSASTDLVLSLKGRETPFLLRVTYRLEPGAFFVRRNLALQDPESGFHFLRWFWPRLGSVRGVTDVVKAGDFGQPVALLIAGGGAFFGLEYPASQNHYEQQQLRCGQEFGEKIGSQPLESEWVVEGITPDANVKKWFFQYLDSIRVAPLRPYTLYNTWYDLRSPEYPKVPPENVMSETSAMKMVSILRKQMMDRYGIKLDAFVLDDGWDIYDSDWVIRKEQWPQGMMPLSEELKKTGTRLGVWLGPTGGYSFRKRRLAWMKDHGYELIGDQMCVAGRNYHALLKKRVTDFVAQGGVGYFKWDGIQFSCNEPDHGHPVDIYSRRAVLESVIDLCRSVREKDPDMFLNITSGTWLSPWWVKYANTIWMDGEDYGYADVPSISLRDGAITYRDFVLYEDFHLKDLWFPIANLMTHGIIKGKLEMLGSPEEPLDKFTDDALLYVARGVSMYELYISPDVLSEDEWKALSGAIAWARDRFPVLSETFMIGGDPMKREPYGYAHFKGTRGIVAARNPFIAEGSLDVELSPSQGLDPHAASLVLERVYPTRWISPQLHHAGERISLDLAGYETAVYELYPLQEATEPLVAGVVFDAEVSGNKYIVHYQGDSKDAQLLNPERVIGSAAPLLPAVSPGMLVTGGSVKSVGPAELAVSLKVAASAKTTSVAILLTPTAGTAPKEAARLAVTLDGRAIGVDAENQESRSKWYVLPVTPGRHSVRVRFETPWSGSAAVWAVAQQEAQLRRVAFELASPVSARILPPRVFTASDSRQVVRLGESPIGK